MRFGYFDFKEIFTKRAKATSPWICMTLAALFVCLCPLTADAQARRINGYAVQIAAMSSQKSADDLVRGLSVRGMNAYWVGGMSYGASRSALHRVRIGNFPTIASASAYAENLLGSGLLETYAIAAYEPPAKAGFTPSWKIQSFAQKSSRRRFAPDVIDVVAAIGSRGWLLLSSESINVTARAGNSALSRELVNLAVFIGSRGWGLNNNNNAAKLLGAAAAINVVSLPSGIIAGAPSTPLTPSASSSSLNAVAPEIGGRELITAPAPSVAIGAPGARSRISNSSASLQGAIEMRGGRMFMTLRNADPDRVFSGIARVSLTGDQKQEEVTPLSVTLLPDKEVMFPLDEATLTDGDWLLTVYDLNGAARLIRGASLGPPKAPAQAPAANPAQAVATVPGPELPPSYVTGVYDTTNWVQPQVPPQIQNIESQDAAVSTAQGTQGSPTYDAAGSPSAAPQVDNGPGPVTVSLRQVAATSENLTLELDIFGQNPLKNITVTLRAGDFQDVRQAFIPTSQGSVPFLVPAVYASAGFVYEVRDEGQRVLATGNGNLSSVGK